MTSIAELRGAYVSTPSPIHDTPIAILASTTPYKATPETTSATHCRHPLETMGVVLVAVMASLVAACAIPFILFPTDSLRLLRRKKYQYEVTFGLYMLTPNEKMVLNSLLFITTSLVLLAAVFYFPSHVSEVSSRVFYYSTGTFLSQASLPLNSVKDRVATINSAIQSSLGVRIPQTALLNASQNVVSGASDLVKGIAAEVAHSLGAPAAAAVAAAAAEASGGPSADATSGVVDSKPSGPVLAREPVVAEAL